MPDSNENKNAQQGAQSNPGQQTQQPGQGGQQGGGQQKPGQQNQQAGQEGQQGDREQSRR
jgi:hypothetical protein